MAGRHGLDAQYLGQAAHFWPLLVAAGAAASALPATVIEGGITRGVLAMDAFVFGGSAQITIDAA